VTRPDSELPDSTNGLQCDPPGDHAVMTVREASHYLRVGSNTVYEAIRRGELPSVRVGRRVLVPRAALETFLSCSGVGQVDKRGGGRGGE
jgi:excisionase family DNA binding protein